MESNNDVSLLILKNSRELKFIDLFRKEVCKDVFHSGCAFKLCTNYKKKKGCWQKYAKIREYNFDYYNLNKL
jgi:hypothetical protein